MSRANEIKQHLKGVEQTRQITNAMYLLSTSRMKKSMENIDFNLLYLKNLRTAINNVITTAANNNLRNKFTEDNGLGSAVVVVVTSDKGLCGGYNSAVAEKAFEELKRHKSPAVISLGLIGDEICKSKGIPVLHSWYGASQHPTRRLAAQVAGRLIPLYLTDDYHEIYIVYTEYVNSAVQRPVCRRLLPLLEEDFGDIVREAGAGESQTIFEPSARVVFDYLVTQYVTGFMYDVFMQSATSENIARMTAMQNATRNADEMIKHLSEQLNAERQLQITNEITEISAAAELNGV